MIGAFSGTKRFSILKDLGEGGMGVVYEALDSERQVRVALKTLQRLDPSLLLRFKREFRALQGVEHPNLVKLFELKMEEDCWFFTMELVDGVDLMSWVRRAVPDMTAAAFAPTAPPTATAEPEQVVSSPSTGGTVDEARLRGVLAQLAAGLAALHAAGLVHRDIKPSNVMVTPEGRVVLLDFGLVADPDEEGRSVDGIVGTVAYMAPEQASGAPVGPAADWYALGVVLYQALVGALPFVGTATQILTAKQSTMPPLPSTRATVAADLEALCMELLRTDPAARPAGAEILRRLGAPTVLATQGSTFVGRERELGLLKMSFEDVQRGQSALVLVEGPSGIGKSALVRQLTRGLAARGTVVLSGRYHEHETVPYRALDSIIDAISRHLCRLSSDAAQAVLPLEAHLLAQIFPALRAVPGVSPVALTIRDPLELRTRAFRALRELLVRLSRRSPVVVVIDDVQWSDPDSRAAFAEVMRPPDPPPILIVATMRSEGTEAVAAALASFGSWRRLKLEPLDDDEARLLAAQILATLEGDAPDADAIVAESAGHPLFIEVLARHVRSTSRGRVRLADALAERVSGLDPIAQNVLELCALSTRPLATETLRRATTADQGQLLRTLSTLKLATLIGQSRIGDADGVEPYHDRVREVVLARLDGATRRAHHAALATALAAGSTGSAELEQFFVHLCGAGRDAEAVPYGVRAAEHAAEVLAFARAARLLGETLQLCTDPVERRRIQALHGLALANCGRGPEAAAAFLAAVAGAPPDEAFELQRRAAEQLLRSGRIEEGLAAVRAVLAGAGLDMPGSPRRALLRLVLNRARLRLRGLGWKERAAADIDPAELRRVDACWSVAGVLGMVDTILGQYFQSRHLHLALGCGEPFRVARALALEVAYSSTAGTPAAQRTAEILVRAEGLAARVDDPYAHAWVRGVGGTAAFLEGRWRMGYERSSAAEKIFRERCVGVDWELSTFRFFVVYSLFFLGRIGELSERIPRAVRDAEERGDVYAVAAHKTHIASVAWLAGDDVALAREQVLSASSRWSRGMGFQLEHYWAFLAESHNDLYAGDFDAARERLRLIGPALASSLILRVQMTRIEAHHLRGRIALGGDKPAIDAAAREARNLRGEKSAWAQPLAALLEAGVAARRADLDGARASLTDAIARFDACDMALYAAAARLQLGKVSGGDEGQALVTSAETWMRSQSIVAPWRMAAMLVPGV